MDKPDLIKHCQLGDVSSFSELYKLYSKKALGTAYLISGNRGLAEDIVHEAFLQCFESIKSLKNIETFDVWFYKIITRTGWRMVNKQRDIVIFDDREENCDISFLSTQGEVNSSETKIIIQDALAELSLPLRTVIILYYFNDMTIKEISKVLECFEGTVKSRLHNAKIQLREILGGDIEQDIKNNYIGKECVSDGK